METLSLYLAVEHDTAFGLGKTPDDARADALRIAEEDPDEEDEWDDPDRQHRDWAMALACVHLSGPAESVRAVIRAIGCGNLDIP